MPMWGVIPIHFATFDRCQCQKVPYILWWTSVNMTFPHSSPHKFCLLYNYYREVYTKRSLYLFLSAQLIVFYDAPNIKTGILLSQNRCHRQANVRCIHFLYALINTSNGHSSVRTRIHAGQMFATLRSYYYLRCTSFLRGYYILGLLTSSVWIKATGPWVTPLSC